MGAYCDVIIRQFASIAPRNGDVCVDGPSVVYYIIFYYDASMTESLGRRVQRSVRYIAVSMSIMLSTVTDNMAEI